MPIYHAEGDILVEGQEHVQMAGVWLRHGYNSITLLWPDFFEEDGRHLYILPHRALLPDAFGLNPWDREDTILEIHPPGRELRFIYAFHTSGGSPGLPTLGSVAGAVSRYLDAARELSLHRVGLIHLNWEPRDHNITQERKHLAAGVMISAIQQWETQHAAYEMHVILYDLRGAFGWHQLLLEPLDHEVQWGTRPTRDDLRDSSFGDTA